MNQTHSHHEVRTKWVVIITFCAMVVEIAFGISTKSMALLADGIHMGSHVLAIGLSWIAYVVVRRLTAKNNFRGSTDKILSLSGYSSGLMLLIFAFYILFQAIERIVNPAAIHYMEAIIVAVAGLIVNLVCAVILHHKQEESDHNIRAAYMHVLADALTSITAIAGLTAAMIWDIVYFDALGAIISSFVIIRWSVGLLRDSGRNLLDIPSRKGA